MNLSNAPFEQLLQITAVVDASLEKYLSRAGLRVGDECHKHLPASLPSVRVKGAEGVVVLGGGLAKKILIECGGETKTLDRIMFEDDAAIVEVKGGRWLQKSLSNFGISAGKKIRLMRRLPPMEYVLRLNNRGRIKISEDIAARIIGSHENMDRQQFSSAKVELDFAVTDIIGGRKFSGFLRDLGVVCGEKIVLEGVEHVSELFSDRSDNVNKNDICLKTRKGSARIHLSNEKAKYVEVKTV